LDRLISVRGATPESFAHDPAGNLLGQNDLPAANLANVKGNRLLMQGDRHYDYDAYGNLSRERRGAGQKLVTEYRYDCQHRLIGVSLPGGSTATYKYDAFGRRIEKNVDGHTTEFLWQGERLIAESAENRYRSYIYEPGSFRPLAMLDGEGPRKATPFYYQLDHLGTPQELTDYSGEIMWSARYRAYGNLAALDVSEIDNPLRFQGQYFDAETGLHYNRHRYYNPGTGRFLTPDPIKLAGGLNNYLYVSNPTGWVDPLGLQQCPGSDSAKPATPVKTGNYLDKPANADGSLNIGAGTNPIEGYYNIDIDPKAPGVHAGNATDLSGIKSGSQSHINMDNPYGYDPLNPEILRVLADNGQITLTGSAFANKYIKKSLKKIEELGLRIVSQTKVDPKGFKTIDGNQIESKQLDQFIIERAK
jgi:RHS repeat-associated protein